MKKKTLVWLLLGSLAFILLIILAVILQSAYLLYAASVVPLLIVPFLPDFRSNQWVKPWKTKNVEIYRNVTGEGTDPDFVVIRFKPGAIKWRKNILYFPYAGLPVEIIAFGVKENLTSITALKHDLVLHPRKKQWIGIRLTHLVERCSGLPYTLKDLNCVNIHWNDIIELLPPENISHSVSEGNSLQA
jgi:hypothetical protein